ncbi:hypothetical protein SBV1_370008 [Verrucomicrobia bacterium]|nr:hypothetical protein SBV1_370008 [Verrucomicrobiota bacterium]
MNDGKNTGRAGRAGTPLPAAPAADSQQPAERSPAPKGTPDSSGSGLGAHASGTPDSSGSSLGAHASGTPDSSGSSLGAHASGTPDSSGRTLPAPRRFFVEVDSLLSWIAHRGWVATPECREELLKLQREARGIYMSERND